MAGKKTGLAQFTKQNSQSEQKSEAQEAKPREKQRGKGDVVALTVRLSRDDWQRVHQLALSEGVSIQRLAVDGLSKLFEEKGLKKLNT